MITKGIEYRFTAKVWQYQGKGGWFFISLPVELSKEIRDNLKWQEEGWGRLKATTKIGTSEWKTAIWFDSKLNIYLLPIKKEIREKEYIQTEKIIDIIIWV